MLRDQLQRLVFALILVIQKGIVQSESHMAQVLLGLDLESVDIGFADIEVAALKVKFGQTHIVDHVLEIHEENRTGDKNILIIGESQLPERASLTDQIRIT